MLESRYDINVASGGYDFNQRCGVVQVLSDIWISDQSQSDGRGLHSPNPQGGRVAMRQHRHSGLDPESRGWGTHMDVDDALHGYHPHL